MNFGAEGVIGDFLERDFRVWTEFIRDRNFVVIFWNESFMIF